MAEPFELFDQPPEEPLSIEAAEVIRPPVLVFVARRQQVAGHQPSSLIYTHTQTRLVHVDPATPRFQDSKSIFTIVVRPLR